MLYQSHYYSVHRSHINEYLEKHLLSFISEHHQHSYYIFWLDLAGCHYSKQTVVGWMKMSNSCLNGFIHQMCPRYVRFRIFVSVWHKRFTWDAAVVKVIRPIESKMKEFDTHFVESILKESQGKSQIYR